MLNLLHASHPGMQVMINLAKQHVWWPRITVEIEAVVRNCSGCQKVLPSQQSTLKAWPVPKENWSRIHVDLAYYRGANILVVADAKSGYIAAEYVRNIEAKEIIKGLRKIFSVLGLPNVLVSDNGTQFVAHETTQWLRHMGIAHLQSPRYHPASNGVAEAAVKGLKNKLKQFNDSRNDKEEVLQQALYAIRVTPRVDGPSPAKAMFGREFNTRLSLLSQTPRSVKTQQQNRPVLVQDPFSKEWSEAVLEAAVGEQLRRIYDNQGRHLTVHRDHVCDLKQEMDTKEPTAKIIETNTEGDTTSTTTVGPRRSGRRRVPIQRYQGGSEGLVHTDES